MNPVEEGVVFPCCSFHCSVVLPYNTLGIRKAAEPLRSNGANAEPGVARPAKFSPGAPWYEF